MRIKNQLPNIITLLNLFCGCIAVIFAVQGHLEATAIFVILGIGFDFFDGLAARLLNAQSALGLQLDSLADMVTSGLAPGIVMYQLLTQVFGKPFYTVSDSWSSEHVFSSFDGAYISLFGLLLTLASGYRLANFNVDTRQANSFIGLPTPANALLIISLPLIVKYQSQVWFLELIGSKWFLLMLTALSCYLLNAQIPLFSLKFKTWGFKENKIRYVFLILAILLIVLLKFLAIPCVILVYVLMSIMFREKRM